MTMRLTVFYALLQLALSGLPSVHAQSLICQDGTGRKITINGSTACPFGLTPAQANTGTPKQVQVPTANAPSRPNALSFEDTVAIQTALKAAGLYSGVVDGLAGPGTEAAITAWQQTQKIPPTGVLTTAQLAILKQQAAMPAAPPVRPPTVAVAPSSVAQQATEEPNSGQRMAGIKVALRDKFSSRIGAEISEKLFMGNDGDILLFTNEQPQAPNFFRRVTGEGVFRNNKMNVCGIGTVRNLDEMFTRYAARALTKLTPNVTSQASVPWSTPCGAINANSKDDVLAILRGDLVKDASIQEQISAALTEKKLRLFNQLDRSPFEILLAQREANGRVLQRQLRAGTLNGLGLLVTRTTNTSVCATKGQDAEYVKRVIAEINAGILTGKEPGQDPKLVFAEIDDVFLRTKRDECGFVFGDGAMLKLMAEAFERDGFSVSLLPVIMPKEKADDLVSQLSTERAAASSRLSNDQAEQSRRAEEAQRLQAEQQAAELQRQAQRRIAIEQQERLDEVRRANDENARREELERIRRVVASRGRAIQDALDARIRKHIASVVKEVADTKQRAKLGQVLTQQEQRALDAKNEIDRLDKDFAAWSRDIGKNIKEEWEFADTKASLEDYGQAKWRGRSVEAISVRVQFPMSNAVIGERATGCTIFTWINDEEFKFWRQGMSSECAAYEADFKKWASANQFTSQWKLPGS